MVNYELIEKLAHIQCTQMEIASILDVNVSTLKRDSEFCTIYKKGQDEGKKALRRIQWDLAKKGNPTMAIWLGKQYLGQRDKQELSGDNDKPLIVRFKKNGK